MSKLNSWLTYQAMYFTQLFQFNTILATKKLKVDKNDSIVPIEKYRIFEKN